MRRFGARIPFRAGVVIGAAMLVAAACGGDSGDEAATDEAAETTTAPDNEETTAASDNDETTTTTEGVTGDGDSEWCQGVRAVEADGGPSPIDFNFFGRTPEQLEEQMSTNLETFQMWAEVAPPEIEADVEYFVSAFSDFVQLGDEAAWDLDTIASDPAFIEAFEGPELEAAATNIDAYTTGVCEVSLGAAPPTTAPPAGDSGDVVADILGVLGLPPSFLPDDTRSCMNDELADDFPDGIGDDFTLDEQTIDSLDAAATTCGVDFGL